jgi:hypothetical protein
MGRTANAATECRGSTRAEHHHAAQVARVISTQHIAATVHRSVLLELTAQRNHLAEIPVAPLDGMARNAATMADTWVAEKFQQLKDAKHHKAYDEALIRDHAENYAALCSRMASLDSRRNFAASVGVLPATGRGITPAGEQKRWDDPIWWRRQLRKVWTRQSEDALREIGMIRKGRQPYASDAAVEHRAGRVARTREWLESRQMVSETGEEIALLELHAKSLANPTLRRQEFMCRVRGFEEFADSQGHIALFWTLTTPSRFHAQHSGGGMNEKWKDERARVRDAQGWLCKHWARARSRLHRLGINPYGVRVAEAHHDATPHWHALLWVPPQQADAIREELREVWLKDSGTEDGAQRRRITCIEIDRAQGSAVGYIAKYIAENIDGAGEASTMIDDETGQPVGQHDVGSADDPESFKRRLQGTIHRVAAWASVHGIRQFQQIGGPPVGLWREFRRLRDPLEATLLESIRAPVDDGEWCEFIGALGGIERARRRVGSVRSKYRRTLRVPKVRARRLAATQWRRKFGPRVVWHMRDALPHELPAAWLDRADPYTTDREGRDLLSVTRYGEAPEPRAAGVCSYTLNGDRFQVAETRIHKWRIEKKCATASESFGKTTRDGGRASGTESITHGENSALESSPLCSRARQMMSAHSDPWTVAALNRGAAWSGSDSFLALGSRSALGPVAITVLKTASSNSAPPDAAMLVPFRERQEERPVGGFVGPPRPLAWLGKFVGPPERRSILGQIRSEQEFRRLAWSMLHGRSCGPRPYSGSA